MGVIDAIAKKAKEVKEGVSSTVQEYSHMGDELKARADQMKTSAPAPVAAPAAPKRDSGKRYGDRPGEKRIDVTEALKPLASYKNGTPYVPKTGVYKLHEGEAVVPKEQNQMDAKTAMEAITGKKNKPPKKIKEIRTRKSDDGKYVHTHLHHHPEHHADEMHVSNDLKAAQAHIAEQEPNMSAQPPEMAPPTEGQAPTPTPGM